MIPYKKSLKDGRAIYIPNWPVDVALENLSKAGKVLGAENLVMISEGSTPNAIHALMSAEDPALATIVIKHFICQVRIDGSKITPETINDMFEGQLSVVMELFVHVIVSQFAEFFSSGLAKANSPDK